LVSFALFSSPTARFPSPPASDKENLLWLTLWGFFQNRSNLVAPPQPAEFDFVLFWLKPFSFLSLSLNLVRLTKINTQHNPILSLFPSHYEVVFPCIAVPCAGTQAPPPIAAVTLRGWKPSVSDSQRSDPAPNSSNFFSFAIRIPRSFFL